MEYEKRLIEGNFPCQQVGAETKRERGASSALPPLYFLHVWWARRPLTPSRAAVLGSILPADVQPDVFLKELGIVKKQAVIGDARWTLVGKNLALIQSNDSGEFIPYSEKFAKAFEKENARRFAMRDRLTRIVEAYPEVAENPTFVSWKNDNAKLELLKDAGCCSFIVETSAADPAATNERIAFASSELVSNVLGSMIRLDDEDRYGYDRAFASAPCNANHNDICVLDPTAGGGSIPFEAERLGCRVIANDLNPVATAIQYATLDYPARFGEELIPNLQQYGNRLVESVRSKVGSYFPDPDDALNDGFLYCREVTCPHCGERAPLLNAFALSKKKDGWMVVPQIEGFPRHKTVRFIPTRLENGKGPHGENPEFGTVQRGTGTCIFCGQAIESEEIKRQARGESAFGTWADRLYCVVGVREQPKLGKDGKPMTYASGPDKGKVRTQKVTFFREPTQRDYDALRRAEEALKANWDHWEEMDLIPTERIPEGHKTAEPLRLGIERWCDMFTPRQLLGLLTAMETLHNMIPEIMKEHGKERGTAIVHYLQYMIDKLIDYNSRQTRWEYTRSVIKGTFGRHDFSLKWTYGEMIFTGASSGLAWGRDQILDAYTGICELMKGSKVSAPMILNGSAASMALSDKTADVICVDPPYYNNVQYAELSDFFYVWQKRTFREIYPDVFGRRLTNKQDEAVANPVRDGSAATANETYEKLMSEIFAECRRVMKDDGVLTMMFTHKTQAAWETLTRALIENGWIISSSFPVDSEASVSMHQKEMAAAASSIFLACRKRELEDREPAVWNGFGGTGVMQQIRQAVRQSLKNYEVLHLNSVDEMVASYGSALKVLSENWPVMDGDEMVSPIRAMREASTVVAQYQMTKLTGGSLSVDDISAEAAIALTLFGINGTGYFAFDDALSLSKSLNIRLEHKLAGYRDEGRMIGINDERTGRVRTGEDEEGYYAPVVKKGSKLRLVLPEERNPKRLSSPQSEWDIMQGMIMAFREGDIPVARAYLQRNAEGREDKVIGVLRVWADGCGSEELRKEAQRMLFGLKDGK